MKPFGRKKNFPTVSMSASAASIFEARISRFLVNEAARIAFAPRRPISAGDILNSAGNNPAAHTAADFGRLR